NRFNLNMLISRSDGVAGFYVSQGLGHQQEYQLPKNTLPIIENSEVVYIDGQRYSRGTDYRMDYEDGSLTFKSHLLPIESYQRVNVEYQYEEGQAAYKKNLIAVQAAGNIDKDNALGFTYVRDAHDKSSPLIEIQQDTGKPMSHEIFDMYLKGKFKNYFKLTGEFARSVMDYNTLTSDDKRVNGDALKLDSSIDFKKYSTHINYRRIEPTFSSVGKKGYVSLGQEGLVDDISQININTSLKPFKYLHIDNIWEKSHTNILDIPGRTSRDFKLTDTRADFNFSNNFTLNLREMDENQKSRDNTLDTQRTIRSAGTKAGYGFLEFEAKGETEERFNNKSDILEDRINKTNFVIATRDVKKVGVSLGYENLSTERGILEEKVADVENLSVNLNINPTRKISAVGIFLNRKEKNLLLNTLNTTTTADLRCTLKPFNSLKSILKYSEIHTKRTLKEKESENTLETPITTATASASFDYSPFKNLNTNLNLKTRDIIDETTSEKFSRSNSLRMKIRLTPLKTMTTTLDYNANQSYNDRATEPISRDRLQTETSLSLKKSFQKGMTFETKYSISDRNHRYDPENTYLEKGLLFRLQKQLNRYVTSTMDYQISDVQGEEDFLKSIFDSSFVYSHYLRNIRLNIRYHFEKEHRDLEKVRHEGTAQLDYKLNDKTKFVGEIKLISQSPDSDIGDGYSATLSNAKIEIRF
ncbi:MAG: hypothetical protein JXR91_06380, partial [Deltaproteobacteria bacterium]|nr:hypothetical protein [Deltaproteobacteria bacterium]